MENRILVLVKGTVFLKFNRFRQVDQNYSRRRVVVKFDCFCLYLYFFICHLISYQPFNLYLKIMGTYFSQIFLIFIHLFLDFDKIV
jgi:hypothetical protein